MTKEQKEIIKALNTVFFQEPFNRKAGEHGLDYWNVNHEDLEEHCRRVGIMETYEVDGAIDEEYLLNIYKIGNDYFLRLWKCVHNYDQYGDEDVSVYVITYIPINPERLCWEEVPKCAEIIEYLLYERNK